MLAQAPTTSGTRSARNQQWKTVCKAANGDLLFVWNSNPLATEVKASTAKLSQPGGSSIFSLEKETENAFVKEHR